MAGIRISSATLLIAIGCSSKIPATGGFSERLIDGEIRHGQGFRVLDLDGDGDLDVVAAFSLTDAVHVYLNEGNEQWEKISVSGPGALVAMDIEVADFDGDGDLDIAAPGLFQRIGGSPTPGELTWFENPGDVRGIWITHPITGPYLYGARSLSAVDVDGDGSLDLVVGCEPSNPPEGPEPGGLWWYSNQLANRSAFVGPLPIDPQIQGVASILTRDIDGDGRVDIVASGLTSRQLNWYQQRADGFYKYTILNEPVFGVRWMEDTLIVAMSGTSTITPESLLVQARPTTLPSAPWDVQVIGRDFGGGLGDNPRIALADFDGDNATEIAVATILGDLIIFSPAEGNWSRRDVRTGYQGITYLQAADIDQDGRVDLVTSTYELGSKDRLAWWKNGD